MSQQTFLNALLPPLSLEGELDVAIDELKQLVEINCDEEEVKQLRLFLTLADLHNLNALWQGQSQVVEGNLTIDELKLWQESPLEMPVFLDQFMHKWRSDEERVRHFDELMLAFYSHAQERSRGFLQEWLPWEQALQVGLAARRARLLQRSNEEFLAFDALDLWQSELLTIAAGGADISGLQQSLAEALGLFDSLHRQPVELFRQMLLLRFNRIEKMISPYPLFSFDRVIAWAAQAQIIQRWRKE